MKPSIKTKRFHYEAKKAEYEMFQWIIEMVTGIDSDFFKEFIYEAGVLFAQNNNCEKFIYSADYWNWFVNQWNITNEDFVRKMQLHKLIDYPIALAFRIAIWDKYCEYKKKSLEQPYYPISLFNIPSIEFENEKVTV
jgi:hypothetical protein